MIANWLKNLLVAFVLQAAWGFAFNGSDAKPDAPQSCQMPAAAASTLSPDTGAHP